MIHNFRLDWQKYPEDLQHYVSNINGSWMDIDRLRFLFHNNFGSLNEYKGLELYDGLIVLVLTLYVYLEIIRIQLYQMGRLSNDVALLNEKYSQFWNKVNKIRNRILIHKEKDNFLQTRGQMASTDPKHFISLILTFEDQSSLEINPLTDLGFAEKILLELNNQLTNAND